MTVETSDYLDVLDAYEGAEGFYVDTNRSSTEHEDIDKVFCNPSLHIDTVGTASRQILRDSDGQEYRSVPLFLSVRQHRPHLPRFVGVAGGENQWGGWLHGDTSLHR